MPHIHETKVSAIHVKERPLTPLKQPTIQWEEQPRKHPGESLMKNIAVSAALVLCAVTLRTGAIPQLADATDVVLTAATDNSILDDQLGKLSFVSALFPEAVLVFGESADSELSMPVDDGIVLHAWSEAEPYIAWQSQSSSAEVNCASAGEVIGVYHGNGSERLVQVMSTDGLACLYGNLAEVLVQTGDAVAEGDTLGYTLPGEACVFEVRRDGYSIDPTPYFAQ